jgi:hypothetical protein
MQEHQDQHKEWDAIDLLADKQADATYGKAPVQTGLFPT